MALLVAEGADPLVRTARGLTVLEEVAEGQFEESFQCLGVGQFGTVSVISSSDDDGGEEEEGDGNKGPPSAEELFYRSAAKAMFDEWCREHAGIVSLLR